MARGTKPERIASGPKGSSHSPQKIAAIVIPRLCRRKDR